MKITEAIAQLEQILEEHGDLEMCTFDMFEDTPVIAIDKTFELLELEYEDEEEITKMCAFVEPIENFDSTPSRPKLTVIK